MLALEPVRSSAPLDALTATVSSLAREPIEALPEAALEEELTGIRRQIDRLELEFARRLWRFDNARGYATSGATTVVGWLRNECRMSASEAHERAQVSRELSELPAVEDAWRQGAIGYHHVVALARSAQEVGRKAFRAMLGELLDAARRLDPSRLRYVTRFLRYCVDPDGAASSENELFERRYLNLSQTLDGAFVLDGQLDAEGGAMLRTAIAALNKPIPGDARTAAQRRADAVTELAARLLKQGSLPTTHGQRPHLVVTVPAASLSGDSVEPGELAGVGAVSRALVRRLACDGSLTQVRTNSAGTPVGVDDTSPVIPPSLRTALAVRDRGCRFPGCDRPPDWTDAHHIKHRADGGPRTLENMVLLCRIHHRAVHEGGWKLELSLGGALEAAPP